MQCRFPRFDRAVDGLPLILVKDGQLLEERCRKERIGRSGVTSAARERLGLERLDQIRYAVLERSGGITVIPRADDAHPR